MKTYKCKVEGCSNTFNEKQSTKQDIFAECSDCQKQQHERIVGKIESDVKQTLKKL